MRLSCVGASPGCGAYSRTICTVSLPAAGCFAVTGARHEDEAQQLRCCRASASW
jgi:hypothetical protein